MEGGSIKLNLSFRALHLYTAASATSHIDSLLFSFNEFYNVVRSQIADLDDCRLARQAGLSGRESDYATLVTFGDVMFAEINKSLYSPE